jgi:dolichol-phosphate mannosyltransferase
MADRVVIVIPTYNEAENIGLICPAIHEVLPGAEILVVDDNSPDGTGRIVEGLATADPRIHLLSRKGKEGLGRAYVAGFTWCLENGFDVVVQMDCDFSHQPRYLPDLLGALADADVVIGSRYVKGGETESWPLKRKVLSMGGNLYARTILGMRVIDLTGGFKAWRRTALETIGLQRVGAAGYAFQMEMNYRAHRCGLRIREVPITFPDRVRGESKLGGQIFWESLKTPWRLRKQVKD